MEVILPNPVVRQQGSTPLEEAASETTKPSQKPAIATAMANVNNLDLATLLGAAVDANSPLALSLERLGANTDTDAVAGFSQGVG